MKATPDNGSGKLDVSFAGSGVVDLDRTRGTLVHAKSEDLLQGATLNTSAAVHPLPIRDIRCHRPAG